MLRSAASGVGGGLIFVGEPGVGKSALLAFAREAAGGSFTVPAATGIESESELAFSGLATLVTPLTSLFESLGPQRAQALRGAVGLVPVESLERLDVYLAAFDLFCAAARERPVLVVVDDLHWLDGASREAVLFVARRAAGESIVVLGSVRNEALGTVEGSSVEQLWLSGLDEDAGVRLALQARPGMSAVVARNLWESTAGNPLALLEVPRLLTEAEASGHAALEQPLPSGPQLQRVFSRRLAEMPSQTRTALLVAAASYTGSVGVITAASQQLGIEPAALGPAETAGLITIRDGEVEWRHPLLRAAAYHAADGPERRAAHSALAEAGRDERRADHRAWHLAAAAVAPDESVASELEEVAEAARARGALSATVRAFRQSALLSPRDEQRSRRLVAGAEAAAAIGSWDEASSMLSDAEERSDAPLLLAQATRVRARVEILRGDPDVAHRRLVTAAEAIKDLDLGLAAGMMAEAVVAHMATGRWDAYFRSAERALELGRQVGGMTEAVAGLVLAPALLVTGRTTEALDLFSRYEAAAWEPALWQIGPEIIGMYGLSQMWLERYDVAEGLLGSAIESARRTGAIRVLSYPLAVSAHLHFLRGRWDVALQEGTEAIAVGREMLGGALLANNLGFIVQIEAGLGHSQAAREHAVEALALCQSLSLGAIAPWALDGLALLDLSEGDYEGAIRHAKAADPNVVAGENDPGVRQREAILCEAYARAGDTQGAVAVLAELEHWSEVTGRTLGHARAARCRGLLAPNAEIEQHFESALTWHRHTDLPFERARTQLCYGERLRRAQRRAAARHQLTDALETFSSLGAAIWIKRVQKELRAAGSRDQSIGAASEWDELTGQESRVAELIIEGATYQEAADQLFLSPRTIESHLRQVYSKLGVRSRTELTRKMSRVPASEDPPAPAGPTD